MKKILILGILFAVIPHAARSQELKGNLYIDTGFDVYGCASPEKDYIRSAGSTYFHNMGYYASSVQAIVFAPHLGIRYEKMFHGNLLGLSAGLRYSQLAGFIGRDDFLTGSERYFYVSYREDGQTTEYARVKDISQRAGYIGVPLELRLTPGKDRLIKIYFRLGTSFNIRLHSDNNIRFIDDQMEIYEEEVAGVLEKPSPYYATLYAGGGLKLGRNGKAGVMLGINALTAVFTKEGTGLVKPWAGAGPQLMVRIPLIKPEQ